MMQTIKLKFFILLFNLLFFSFNIKAQEFIIIQSTTSTRDSGFYDYLLPKFQEKFDIEVRVIAVGTGQAIKNAKNCDADLLLVHHKPSEVDFLKQGFGLYRKEIMYNDYVIIGPKNDPINFIHNEVGYNLRMTNLHAAIGLSQIKHLKKIINKRKKIHKAYLKNINPIPGLKLLRQTKNSFSNFWLNVLKVDESKFCSSKTKLIKHLLSKGIEVRSVWFPNHLQKPFIKNESYKIKNSHKLFKKSLCLPSSYTLSNKQLFLWL